MTTKVLVPRLGEGVDEVTVTKWLKQVGDTVNELEPLLEVNTDKVDTEIPAPATGTVLKIAIPEGTAAKVGELLALIGAPGEAATDDRRLATVEPTDDRRPTTDVEPFDVPSSAWALRAGSSTFKVQRTPDRALGFISPVVARLAGEYGLDLTQIPGTGLNGRITKKDVLVWVEAGKQVSGNQVNREPASLPQPVTPSPSHPVTQSPSHPAPQPTTTGLSDYQTIPHTTIRRRIAEHMVHSKHTSPHVTTVMEVDLSRVAAHRQTNKAAFAGDGVNLTFTPYFVSAIVDALKAYPMVNSSWSDDALMLHKAINIGMATSLGDEGLIVPVIKNADSLSLLGLARTVNDLAARARAHKLQPDEVKGGTFTLTNHGISGSLFATPVINQPQCGILGVGAIQKRAIVLSDEKLGDVIAIRPMAYISLTFDHRILDGASADWFLARVVQSLASW